jgi:hypothetical protein
MHRNLLAIGAIIVISAMVVMVPATTISVDAVCGGSVKACASADGGSAFAIAKAGDNVVKVFVGLFGAIASTK